MPLKIDDFPVNVDGLRIVSAVGGGYAILIPGTKPKSADVSIGPYAVRDVAESVALRLKNAKGNVRASSLWSQSDEVVPAVKPVQKVA